MPLSDAALMRGLTNPRNRSSLEHTACKRTSMERVSAG